MTDPPAATMLIFFVTRLECTPVTENVLLVRASAVAEGGGTLGGSADP
ncbi:MAG: hypothetical protein M3Y35_04800 [Actinomycetota bacterium]|nr:hypothetical protein [Actinomycetota bacterium]